MKDYSQYLGYWVKHYYLLANQAMDAALKPYGIGRSQWHVLFLLQTGEEIPQRKLQQLLHIESATLTNLIAPLVKKGLIEQRADTMNKRNKVVKLSNAGNALWQRMPDPIDTVMVRALRGIPVSDIAVAREVLKAAAHNLEEKEVQK